MQTVFEHIACHGITETVEEVHADADERQVNPGLVAEQVCKGLQRELLSTHGLQTLLGEQSAGQRAQRGNDAKENSQHSILVLLGATHHLLQIGERQQGNEAHGVCTYHTERGELVLLVIVGSHHAQQRAVRHVDGGIDHHHEQIEGICPDALTYRTELWCVEQQGENQSQGYSTKDEPRAIGAPATLGAVGQRPHDRVGHHIEHTGYEHQHSRIGYGQSEDVGEEQREGNGHDLPRDTTRCGIAQRISNLFS